VYQQIADSDDPDQVRVDVEDSFLGDELVHELETKLHVKVSRTPSGSKYIFKGDGMHGDALSLGDGSVFAASSTFSFSERPPCIALRP